MAGLHSFANEIRGINWKMMRRFRFGLMVRFVVITGSEEYEELLSNHHKLNIKLWSTTNPRLAVLLGGFNPPEKYWLVGMIRNPRYGKMKNAPYSKQSIATYLSGAGLLVVYLLISLVKSPCRILVKCAWLLRRDEEIPMAWPVTRKKRCASQRRRGPGSTGDWKFWKHRNLQTGDFPASHEPSLAIV